MVTDASPPNLETLGAPSSCGILTKLTIDGSSDVNNMKIANPPVCSLLPAVVVQASKPQSPSTQADVPTVKEDKSTFRIHAYSRAGVIKPGTYSRSLRRSAKGLKIDCARCNAVFSVGIDHCHKHDNDKYGKGPLKRVRR